MQSHPQEDKELHKEAAFTPSRPPPLKETSRVSFNNKTKIDNGMPDIIEDKDVGAGEDPAQYPLEEPTALALESWVDKEPGKGHHYTASSTTSSAGESEVSLAWKSQHHSLPPLPASYLESQRIQMGALSKKTSKQSLEKVHFPQEVLDKNTKVTLAKQSSGTRQAGLTRQGSDRYQNGAFEKKSSERHIVLDRRQSQQSIVSLRRPSQQSVQNQSGRVSQKRESAIGKVPSMSSGEIFYGIRDDVSAKIDSGSGPQSQTSLSKLYENQVVSSAFYLKDPDSASGREPEPLRLSFKSPRASATSTERPIFNLYPRKSIIVASHAVVPVGIVKT
ncbi:hypothetical protein HDU91_003711, partial [Kappamyces sp. JEL0680]